MRKSGVALMGSSIAEGEERALNAIEEALNSPLLNNNDINGAQNILLNITSGAEEVTMDEIGEITDYVQSKAGNNADLIWGNGIDENLGDKLSVTVIATGFSVSSIPEMMAGRKVEKTYHTLVDDSTPTQPVSPKPHKPSTTKENTEHSNQQTFEFEIGQSSPDEFDELYKNPTQTEPETNFDARMDFSSSSDEMIDQLENTPAFQRKKINIHGMKRKIEDKLSRFSLNQDDDDKNIL